MIPAVNRPYTERRELPGVFWYLPLQSTHPRGRVRARSRGFFARRHRRHPVPVLQIATDAAENSQLRLKLVLHYERVAGAA
jgi:hypothetical protein